MLEPSVHNMFFFFNDTATTEIYTLSLHDALPIYDVQRRATWDRHRLRVRLHPAGPYVMAGPVVWSTKTPLRFCASAWTGSRRSEEHTSELQSRQYLVCRLLLEKKKQNM